MVGVRQWRYYYLVPGLTIFILLIWVTNRNECAVPFFQNGASKEEQGISSKNTADAIESWIPHSLSSSLETNPIPDDATLKKMGVGELSDFFHGYIMSTQVLCNRRLRMGKIQDGGWDVCDDPQYKPTHKNCVVYSFGIGFDFSFDDAIAEHYECEVHSFDPRLVLDILSERRTSMKKTTDHLRGKLVHFHDVGIGGFNQNKTGAWPLFTLGTLREQNHPTVSERPAVDIVKIDVEGAELPSLFKAIEEGSLKDVTQLCFETHMDLSQGDPTRDRLIQFLRLLRNLWNEGFRLFHSNRNITPVVTYISRIHNVPRTLCHELHLINIRRNKFQ